jgi:hypothetical protein
MIIMVKNKNKKKLLDLIPFTVQGKRGFDMEGPFLESAPLQSLHAGPQEIEPT